MRKQRDRLEKALPQILDGYCSKSDKPREIAEQEAKAFLQIIEDSANYQFGYNHSTGYSMIGYMCAYLRYYYPKEFITAYLNNANNDDDIKMGTDLAKTLGIEIHTIKFRKSSSKYTCDESGIYKGIGSIKYIGDNVGEELYLIKDKEFDSFADLINYIICETSIKYSQLDILTKLNFFSEFGNINTLLRIIEIYKKIYNKSQFSKDKIHLYNITEEMISKYAKKITEKLYKDVDVKGLFHELVNNVNEPEPTFKERILYELEYLGYPITVNEKFSKREFIVIDINSNKVLTMVSLYSIKTGKQITVNIWNTQLQGKPPLTIGDFIFISCIEKKCKREPTGEINKKTGKRVYRDVPDQFDFWLQKYEIINDKEV